MSVRDGTERRVSFNTKDELGDKIDKLTVVMSKLAAKDSHERKHFKLQIYKSRDQNRSYGQRGYHNRSDSRSRGQTMNNSPRQIQRGNRFRGNTRRYSRQDDRGNYINERYMKDTVTITEIGIDLEKEISQEITITAEIEA